MAIGMQKIEAILRVLAIMLLVLTSCLIGFDSQTKSILFITQQVTYKYLKYLIVLMYMDAVAAAYNMLQLSKSYVLACYKGNSKGSNLHLSWVCFLLDQIAVYITYGVTMAAAEQSVLVLTGEETWQWMKWCNRFSRFCFQMGGALLCGFIASILMACISCISAFNLFRLYSPQHFLLLKSTS